MKLCRTIFATLAAGIFLAACQSTSGEPTVTSTSTAAQAAPVGGPMIEDLEARGLEPLDTEALKKLHVGNQILHTNLVDERIVMTKYFENGIRAVTYRGKTTETPYEIADGQRCEASLAGGTFCLTVYQVDGIYYGCGSRSEGACDWRIEVVQ